MGLAHSAEELIEGMSDYIKQVGFYSSFLDE